MITCKKTISIAVLIIMMANIFSLNVYAGCFNSSCLGDSISNINYEFDKTKGHLTLLNTSSETGQIASYAYTYNDLELENIKTVKINDSVKKISKNAFKGCTNLESIIIPNSVTNICKYAFENCTSLKSITIYNSETNVDNEPSVDNEEPLIYNETSADNEPSTKSENLKKIEEGAFKGCTSLTSITIPNSVTKIGDKAFSGCTGLKDVSIGGSVKQIGDFAFNECIGLTSITIPDSVTTIGDRAFYGCKNLSYISIRNFEKRLGDGCMGEIIYYGVKNIGKEAFSECEKLKSVHIPNSVTTIGDYAFSDCIGLQSIKIGNGAKKIGEMAFNNCTALKFVSSLVKISDIGGIFNNCEIQEINIPEYL